MAALLAAIPGAGVLEDEFQTELNQSRCGAGIRTVDHTLIRTADCGIRRGKLRPVEDVEDLGSEIEAEPVIRTEAGALEDGEVEVPDPVSPQRWIGAGFVTEGEVGWRGEAGSVEPLTKFGRTARASRFVAASYNIGPRTAAVQGGVIGIGVGENEREYALKHGDAINAPAADEFFRHAGGAGEKLLAAAERKIQNVADDQPLGNVLGGERAFALGVIVVLDAAGRDFKPIGKSVRIADQLGIGISDDEGTSAGKT